MPPEQAVNRYLQTLEAETRTVADGEWGVTIADAGGWPLDIGMRLDRGVLRAQTEVLRPDQVADHELLYRNRGLLFVRYAHNASGTVYVMGELPPELITPEWLDRLLGMLVDAAIVARHRARAAAALDD